MNLKELALIIAIGLNSFGCDSGGGVSYSLNYDKTVTAGDCSPMVIQLSSAAESELVITPWIAGTFFSDSACNDAQDDEPTISKGSKKLTFYFKSTFVGEQSGAFAIFKVPASSQSTYEAKLDYSITISP